MIVSAVGHKIATVLAAILTFNCPSVVKELKKTVIEELHCVQSCASVCKVPFYIDMIMIA